MSYILEALRKADAQRQRTRLPGLQAQATSVPAEATTPAWRSPIAWLLAGGLLVAMLVLAWPGSQPAPSAAPTVVAAPPVTSPPAPAVAESAPQTQAPVAATSIQPAPPPPKPAAEPQNLPPARSAKEHEPAPARAAPAQVAAGPAVASSAAGPAESSTPPPGVPKLAITGGVYSADASQRLLIVGGQVFNEGSEIAPGVVLEQVRPGRAVLSYQGQRFTARY